MECSRYRTNMANADQLIELFNLSEARVLIESDSGPGDQHK